MDGLINLFILLLLLTVLVLLHEVGHFVAARLAGVTVHEFGIGFPPRARVLFTRGATTYTLNWLPIGGFVRMEGEERSPADGTPDDDDGEPSLEPERIDEVESLDPHAFVNQTLAKRLTILVAGAGVNFLIAWLVFTSVAFAAEPTWKVRLGYVQPDSPAASVGLVGGEFVETIEYEAIEDGVPTGEMLTYDVYDDSGDLIVAIDGQAFPVFDDLSRTDAASTGRILPIEYLADNAGETVTLTVEHLDGTVEEVEVTLRPPAEAAERGALGFRPGRADFGEQSNGLVDSMVTGLEMTAETSTLILRAVGNLVVGIFSGTGEGIDEVAGPVGMISVIGTVRTDLPPIFLVWFIGLISANLAVINLLPIPPLDGSRMVMAVVQRVSGNRVSPAAERMVYFTGWVALMVFLVVVTIGDVRNLLP